MNKSRLIAVLVITIAISIVSLWRSNIGVHENTTVLKKELPTINPPSVLDREMNQVGVVDTTINNQNTLMRVIEPLDEWERLPAWNEALKQSQIAHDFLFRAKSYPSIPVGEQETLLFEAYALAPDDFFVNHQILIFCHETPTSTLCGLPFIQTLFHLDGDNILLLRLIASYQYRASDINQALKTLSKAGSSQQINDVKTRYLNLVDQSYRRLGIDRSFANVHHYDDTVRGMTYNMGVGEMCAQQVAMSSQDWISACQAFGVSLAKNSKDPNTIWAGNMVQVAYSGVSPEKYNSLMDAVDNQFGRTEFNLLDNIRTLYPSQSEFDRRLNRHIADNHWNDYLQIYRERGQFVAHRFLFDLIKED